ncbi:M48 family metallopeptidase [Legionella sp. CNM-4043-24]|uniref:M48 family metallopeptidase n=1 Tax=Legionella sp. CNM-4043-24 TaxID=3421646 RepID=UPI00403B24EA
MLINGIEIQLTRRFVKQLRLSIHPPEGMVRVTAPWFVSQAEIHRMITSKMSWIEEKQAAFRLQKTAPKPMFVSGETHYVQGKAHSLQLIEKDGRPRVFTQEPSMLIMQISASASAAEREAVLNAWYRNELKRLVPSLIEKWETIMQVKVLEWRIKKMKTRWGTCNARARRIWLNLDLARQSGDSLEYVIVHELVHFFERHHNARFKAYMDTYLPDWRSRKAQLNAIKP